MKSAALMVFAGVTLFAGTVVGLLAIQGRLNFDGTRGLPVLENFFPAPPGGEVPEDAELVDATGRLEGLGREEPLPREISPSVGVGDAENPGGTPVGRPEDELTGADGESGGHEGGDDVPAPGIVKSLMGQDQYRRGKLFEFPHLESGMTVAELDELAASVQQHRAELERREAAIEQSAAELSAREADIQERERAVLAKMREVLQERSRLEEEFTNFQKLYTLVRKSEVAQHQSFADQLASLSSEQSANIVLRMWDQSEEQRTKVVKILKLMPRAATDEIFNQLTAEQTHAILDRLSGTVVEEQKK